MSDLTSKFGLPWRTSNSPRKYVHGLLRFSSSKARRCPPLKNMAWYASGSLADNWPVTADFTDRDSSNGLFYIHPVIDPNWGICAYGYNIFGTGITSNDLGVIPTGFSKRTRMGPVIGVQNAVSFWNDSYDTFWTMPSILSTDKIQGVLYGQYDSKIHVRNNLGIVDNNDTSRLQSSTGKFPYYLIDKNAFVTGSPLTGRTDISIKPSCFAVVACSLCTPVGIGMAQISTTNTDTIYPWLQVNTQTDQVSYLVYSTGSTTIWVLPTASKDGTQSIHVTKIHDNGTTAVYFLWSPPGFSTTLTSSMNPSYVFPPTICCTPHSGASEIGATMYCRILQYGVEWNL